MKVIPLQEQHLEDATRLFAGGYRRQREQLPILPARHEDPGGVVPMLSDLLGSFPGVAALEGGRLCGYLIGLPIPSFKGTQRGAFVPIWGHAATGQERAGIYWRMYERLSREWVANGCLTHAISLYAQDGEAVEAWFRQCFGLLVMDALRPLEPIAATDPADVEIRQAGRDDVDLIRPLALALDRHLADAPVFLALLESPSRADHASWLAEPEHSLWLALHDGEAVAYMRGQPPTENVGYVVSDPKTISITGAYTRPGWRGQGMGTALLGRILAWARANGYERCAVDFESQNIEGSHFWLRHFQPVCYSLIRRVDERIAWAHSERCIDRMW